mmetsp:Transcript_27680/g.45795  ORF Transcript_27680/g.45795 Transcript_27680/m.45795 type:complete len:249 (-) Transcript_27680:275-1021(-)
MVILPRGAPWAVVLFLFRGQRVRGRPRGFGGLLLLLLPPECGGTHKAVAGLLYHFHALGLDGLPAVRKWQGYYQEPVPRLAGGDDFIPCIGPSCEMIHLFCSQLPCSSTLSCQITLEQDPDSGGVVEAGVLQGGITGVQTVIELLGSRGLVRALNGSSNGHMLRVGPKVQFAGEHLDIIPVPGTGTSGLWLHNRLIPSQIRLHKPLEVRISCFQCFCKVVPHHPCSQTWGFVEIRFPGALGYEGSAVP